MKMPFFSQPIGPGSRWKTSPHLTCTATDGQIAVVDAQEGKVYHFNGVGAAVWQGLNENKEAEAIVLKVAEQYDAPAQKIRKEVFRFISNLCEQDLIEPADKHD